MDKLEEAFNTFGDLQSRGGPGRTGQRNHNTHSNPNQYTSGSNQHHDRPDEYAKDQDKLKRQNDDPTRITDTFQRDVRDRLIRGLDTFLSIPPSRGKTSPIMGGFTSILVQYFAGKTNNPPVLLYVVPTKQLAAQVARNDAMTNILYDLFFPQKMEGDARKVNELFENKLGQQNFNNTDFMEKVFNSLIAEVVGGGNTDYVYRGNIPEFKKFYGVRPIIVATYEKAAEIVKKESNKLSHIIIDEVQELVPRPRSFNITENLDKYNNLVSIISNASDKSSLTLMTGSINNESVHRINDYFNRKYARHFKVVPEFDPERPQLNRSQLVLQPLQSISGHTEAVIKRRIELCKDIITSGQTNTIFVIFSTKLTGQGVFRLIQEVIPLVPPRPEISLRNEANSDRVTVFINQEKRQRSTNTRIDIAGQTVSEIEYLKYFNIDDLYKGGANSTNTATTPDPDNLLFQGVLRGIAPIMGKMDQQHKDTIMKLFTQRKINVILATDALGVGANVDCRFLYIPTTSKFNGNKMAIIDESSLTQLAHRTGRGKFGNGVIYTGIENFEYLNDLIFNDPRSHIPEINPYILEIFSRSETELSADFIKRFISNIIFHQRSS